MKKLLFIFVMTALTAGAQTAENNPKDLWTHSVEVDLGDNWKQKTITVPGKGTPNVIDFFRAFAKAYPCEYHDLFLQYLDGDEEVLFRHEKPQITIDKDSCFLRNESFSMRVFYEKDQPVVLGVCCHKELITKLKDAYYYRYNPTTRKLTPLAQGSDFTGGILKRETVFPSRKDDNTVLMTHRWGRCGIDGSLRWEDNKFVFTDNTKQNFILYSQRASVKSLFSEYLMRYGMELREPETPSDLPGSSYTSLPICVAIEGKNSGKHYAEASAMEGFYDFYARGWERADSTLIVAIYTECAPKFDYDFSHKNEDGSTVKTPHKLEAGDEVFLQFYLCDNKGMASYLDPKTDSFTTLVGIGLPNLERNEWRCVLSPDNEDLLFVRESDGLTKVFKWEGDLLKEQ